MNETAATALYVLAHTLLENARPEQASVLLAALDTVEPGQSQTLLALATARLRQGRAIEALRTLDRLSRSGYGAAPLHLLRAQALRALGRHDEAHAAISHFLRLRAAPPSIPLRTQAA